MSFSITQGSGATIAADQVGTADAPGSGELLQYIKLDYGAAGSSTPVTTGTPLPAAEPKTAISVTLVLDTSAYANGDLLVDAQEIANAVLVSGGAAELESLMVIDEDDQGAAFDVYVTSASDSWGTFNSAPSITDSVARSIQAIIPVGTSDYKDLGGVQVANIKNIGAIVKGNASTSLYVAVVNGSGTPTYTASGVRLVFGFKQSN